MAEETNVEYVVIYRDVEGQWRWRALAANHEIVATGESYTRPQDAERAARGVFGDDVVLGREAEI